MQRQEDTAGARDGVGDGRREDEDMRRDRTRDAIGMNASMGIA